MADRREAGLSVTAQGLDASRKDGIYENERHNREKQGSSVVWR
jgi:hypothetical protein